MQKWDSVYNYQKQHSVSEKGKERMKKKKDSNKINKIGLNREKRWNKYNKIQWNTMKYTRLETQMEEIQNFFSFSDLAVKRKRGKKIDINMQKIVRANL